MKAFTCPYCAGAVRFDIGGNSVQCEYCGSTVTREDYQKYLDKYSLYKTVELVCPQCSASILSYDDTVSTFCSYCGSSVVFSKRVIEETRPDGIMPFKVTKDEALAAYRKRLDDSWFAPDWLKEDGEDKFIGVYMPFYSFRGEASGKCVAKGTRKDFETVTECLVNFDLSAVYDGTRFDASEAFPDSLSESIDTFDPQKAVPFETSYLAGFYADGGNVDSDEYAKLLTGMITDDIKQTKVSAANYDINMSTVSAPVNISRKKYLLPVWFGTHRRKDRVCYSAVNGNDATCATDIPIDTSKYVRFAIILAAAASLVLNLMFTFKPDIFLFLSTGVLFAFGFILRKVSGEAYIREHNLDDIGRIGGEEFLKNASHDKSPSGSRRKKPGSFKWLFKVPFKVRLKAWWKLIVFAVAALMLQLFGIAADWVYYVFSIIGIGLSIWSAFEIIRRQNILASRDAPVFTMKRGGDGND